MKNSLLVILLLLGLYAPAAAQVYYVADIYNSTAEVAAGNPIEDTYLYTSSSCYGAQNRLRAGRAQPVIVRIRGLDTLLEASAVIDSAFLYLRFYYSSSSYFKMGSVLVAGRMTVNWNEGNYSGVTPAGTKHGGANTRSYDYNNNTGYYDSRRWRLPYLSGFWDDSAACPITTDDIWPNMSDTCITYPSACDDSVWVYNDSIVKIGAGAPALYDTVIANSPHWCPAGDSVGAIFPAPLGDSIVAPDGMDKSLTSRIEITALARLWYDGTIAENGIYLSVGNTYEAGYFRSSNNSTFAYRPRCLVYYHTAGGAPEFSPVNVIQGVYIEGVTLNP